MKILEMIATIGVGGAEGLVCDLSIELAKNGADVKLFLLAGSRGERGELLNARLKSSGVEVVGVEPRKPSSIDNVCRIASLFSEWQPDIVHCHLYSAEVAAVISKFFSNFKPKILIRTIHNTDVVGSRSKILSRFLCKIFRYNIACSKSVAESYINFFGDLFIDSVITIPNGCRLPFITINDIEKSKARNEFCIPRNAFVFCNIGAFRGKCLATSQKAQDVLLKSFSIAFQNNDDAFLVFAGDGPLRAEAEVLVCALGCQSRVIFLGDIPDSLPLLIAADVFVMPSRHEGLSLALIEAASAGLPLVVSDIKEITSLDPEGEWLVNPVDDCMAFACSLREVRDNYRDFLEQSKKKSILIREKYSIEKCGEEYFNFFRNIFEISTT